MGRPGPLELSALAKNCAADDTETSIDIVAWPWAVEGHQAPTSMFGTCSIAQSRYTCGHSTTAVIERAPLQVVAT